MPCPSFWHTIVITIPSGHHTHSKGDSVQKTEDGEKLAQPHDVIHGVLQGPVTLPGCEWRSEWVDGIEQSLFSMPVLPWLLWGAPPSHSGSCSIDVCLHLIQDRTNRLRSQGLFSVVHSVWEIWLPSSLTIKSFFWSNEDEVQRSVSKFSGCP